MRLPNLDPVDVGLLSTIFRVVMITLLAIAVARVLLYLAGSIAP